MKKISFILVCTLCLMSVEFTLLFPNNSIGRVILVISSLISIVALCSFENNRIGKKIFLQNIWGILFIVYCFFLLLSDINFESIKIFTSIVCIVITYIYFSVFGCIIFDRQFRYLFSFLIMILMFTSFYVSISKNIQGGVFFYCSILLLFLINGRNKVSKKSILIFIGTIICIAFLTNYRSLLMYILALIVLFKLFENLNNTLIKNTMFTSLVVLIFALIAIYSTIDTFYWFDDVNNWMLDNSGRQIVSGRQEIWPKVILMILNNPILGSGLDASYSDFNYLKLSEHNFYLSLIFKSGFIGLALVFLWLKSIWNVFNSRKNVNYLTSFGMATFIVFIVHNSLEVLMFYNGTVASIMAWIVIGITVSNKDVSK